ncbi:MAG: helicase-exonuclease AddAB subunit AddA [Faecousia sp.]
MADMLTTEQKMAVENRGGALLVSAAAGSGKTKVLVDRLLGYILDPVAPANIDDFLIITYTKAAAAELRARIGSKLAEKVAQMPGNVHLQRQLQRLYLAKISTVHAFCSEILREYAYKLDIYADFRVADEGECSAMRQQVMEEVLNRAYDSAGEDGNFRAFVDTQGFGRDDRAVAEILMKVYDSARCHFDPEGWLDQCIENANHPRSEDASGTVWGKFLMDDLFRTLDLQRKAMGRCLQLAEETPGFEKVAENLRQTAADLDTLGQQTTWDGIVSHRNVNYGRLVFPKKKGDPMLSEQIKAVRNSCKAGLEKKLRGFTDDSAQVLRDLEQTGGAVSGMVKLVRSFRDAYAREKKRHRVLDFSDLEHLTLDLLLGRSRGMPTVAAREIGSRFREILVDEYQDTNAVQDAIFSALTGQRNNCFMVGDVKQSIYQFRLADPGIFLEKYARFAPAETAEPGQGRTVSLCRNFRSGASVLEAANDVFRLCMSPDVGGLYYSDREALVEGIPHQPLGEPEVELHAIAVRDDTYGEEAAFTARRISELTDGTHMIREGDGLRPITPGDIVILLRSPNSVGGEFQNALAARNIRFVTDSGQNLLETPEIRALRSILQVLSNPHQDIPLLAVLASPVFGFTADDLARIRGKNKYCDFYDALVRDGSARSAEFLQTIESLRSLAKHVRLSELIGEIFHRTDLDRIYGAMERGEERLSNLRFFYRYAADFEATERRDLDQFLDQLTILDEKGLRSAEDKSASDAVRIMSIHKSKGLEFPVVFLCGLSRDFNREATRAAALCDSELGVGLSAVDTRNRVRYPTIAKRALAVKMERESTSEEMRVLYVAMTRAKDRLIMTYASRYLESRVGDLGLLSGICPTELLSAEASNPGRWVLMAALRRTEAGELFRLGATPADTSIGEHPWRIRVHDGENAVSRAPREECPRNGIPEGAIGKIRQGLSFTYSHDEATRTPSKQTATQLKGRLKDQEAAEQTWTETQPRRTWRTPSFAAPPAKTGAQVGTATHAAMQYIRYERCGDTEGVRQELRRLARDRLLSPEQAEMVDPGRIAAFFATPLGQTLAGAGDRVLREFKFSILDKGARYGENLQDERVLLQGVVDCALIEADGITVLDFKTDYVTEETLPDTVRHYLPQVCAYAEAMSRIYEKKVKQVFLYFFRLNRLVEVPVSM